MRCRSFSLLLIAAAPLLRGEDTDHPKPPSDESVPVGETIVVTPERRETTLSRTADDVDVVDQDELRLRGHPLSAWEWLEGLPGVNATPGAGGIDGGIPRLKVRGANSYDTQVRVDGIPLEDPTATQGQPDLAALFPAGLERVEVVRGAQSGVYGSRAVGGVVDYQTLRPTAKPQEDLRVEGGTWRTVDGDVDATGPIGKELGYAIAGAGLQSRGFSAQTNPGSDGDPSGHETDRVRRAGISGRLEWKPRAGQTWYVAANSVALDQAFDSFNPDDPVSHSNIRAYRGAAGGDARLDDRLTVGGDAAYTGYDKWYTTPFGTTTYYGHEVFGDAHARYRLLPRLDLAAGVDGRHQGLAVDSGGYTHQADSLVGGWAQVASSAERYEATLTAREDHHSQAGNAATWRAAGAVFVLEDNLKPHASAGTGFRAPSLYELHDAFVGNPDLEPQRSFSWDAGLSYLPQQSFIADCAILDVTYFHTRYHRLIDYVDPDTSDDFIFPDPTPGRYENISAFAVEGIESSLRLSSPDIPVFLRLSYTWQEALEIPSQAVNSYSTYLPEHLFAALVALRERIGGREGWLAVGVQRSSEVDAGYGGGTYLRGYTVWNASAGVILNRTWEIYGRGVNLFDEHYEVNPTYSTAGQSFYLGAGAHF
jgi:vitamin B12 transporter